MVPIPLNQWLEQLPQQRIVYIYSEGHYSSTYQLVYSQHNNSSCTQTQELVQLSLVYKCEGGMDKALPHEVLVGC